MLHRSLQNENKDAADIFKSIFGNFITEIVAQTFLVHDNMQNPFTYNYISWNHQNQPASRDKSLTPNLGLYTCVTVGKSPHLEALSVLSVQHKDLQGTPGPPQDFPGLQPLPP